MLCPNRADHKNSKYYALADITLLRFDVRIYTLRARAAGRMEAGVAEESESCGIRALLPAQFLASDQTGSVESDSPWTIATTRLCR